MSRTMVDIDALAEAVRLACRAPSIHNSQPWLWVAEAGALELHLDATRLVSTDSSGRQALLSCGAALDHLRVATAAAGWVANVDRYPNPSDHRHLASIDFTELDYVTEGHRLRADAIRQRRTDRLPFTSPPGWPSVESTVRRTVGDTVIVDVLGDTARSRLIEASALTEAARLYDSAYHAELDWWTSSFDVTSGIPRSSLVSAAEARRVGVGRRFPTADHLEQRTQVRADESSIVVLSTYDDTRLDVLRCGEALSQVLLDATMAGLVSCTLTHLTEIPASRRVVAALTGRDQPQVLIRIGATPGGEQPPPPTPRRTLSDVLTVRG